MWSIFVRLIPYGSNSVANIGRVRHGELANKEGAIVTIRLLPWSAGVPQLPRALKELGRTVESYGLSWIVPAGDKWQLDLDKLRDAAPDLASMDWFHGRVILEPELQVNQSKTGDGHRLEADICFQVVRGTTILESRQPDLRGIELFYSYSHRDERLRVKLVQHLSVLVRQGIITGWDDRRIGAGQEWRGAINDHLNTAHIILLLVSSDFVASDYCYDVEMTRALERHSAGEARVIPVILREVDWKEAPFGKLQALPTDAKPVTSWRNRDEAFANVAHGIRSAVVELASAKHPA